MKFYFMLLVSLFSMALGTIEICKYVLLTSTPSPTTGYYQCTTAAVADRICSSTSDYYDLIVCEQKTGGAVNIVNEFGVRYLLLGEAYSAHYLSLQP